jgi:uncharacterized OB-fold protein
MSTAESVNAAEGLFAETAEGPRLLGSLCKTCNTPYCPRSAACHNPECTATDMEDANFGPRGKLWSVALQNYPPPPPTVYQEPFDPYAVGIVDLPNGLRVLGRIVAEDPMAVEVGAEMELVVAPLGPGPAGESVMSWQFKAV